MHCTLYTVPTVHFTLCVVGEANGAPISTDPVKLNQGSNYRHDVFYILCTDRSVTHLVQASMAIYSVGHQTRISASMTAGSGAAVAAPAWS